MAKLTITPAVPASPPPPPASPAKFTLELTPQEAATLFIITQKTGGQPETSLRGFIDNIGRQFNGINGLHYSTNSTRHVGGISSLTQNGRGLFFEENSKTSEVFQAVVKVLENAR